MLANSVCPPLAATLRAGAEMAHVMTGPDGDKHEELLIRANAILKAFHQRQLQQQTRRLDALIASTPREDVAALNTLQAQKIALRKAHAVPPSLS